MMVEIDLPAYFQDTILKDNLAVPHDRQWSRRPSTTMNMDRPPQVSTLGTFTIFFRVIVTITSKSLVAMPALLFTDETSLNCP